MEPHPTLSVLMPVYNGRDYIRPAIDSVLNQTFRDFELIIVNDGSTDDTLAIVQSYIDPRIVIINQKNMGVARSLNNGLAAARGEYVKRHDADDTSTPEAFQVQIDFLKAHPDFVMVSNQIAFMSTRGKIARNHRQPQNRYFNSQPYQELSVDDFRPDNSSPVIHATVCFKLREVLDLGGYRPEFIVSEDNDLWIRMAEKYRIAVLNTCNYFVRLHGTSATKVHAGKIKHFRKLLFEFSEERRTVGTDPIMRGEKLPPIPVVKEESETTMAPKGKNVRDDLRFIYGLMIDAGDWPEVRKYGGQILRDGWKSTSTWKMLLFPLIGDKLIKSGVAVKALFRKK
jgi:glycosyltransferase involved in cell wall biosynthesis